LFLTYQYGLRPTREQHRRLEAILEGQRLLYNAALEERSEAWSKSHKSVTRIDQIKSLTTIRADDPQGYGTLPANLSRWTLKRVDEAFQAFFSRIKAKSKAGFPRFKSMRRWRSFGFTKFSGIRLIDGALVFKGMSGRLELHLHRPLPDHASIRSCTLTKKGRGWSVALQIEVLDVHAVRREAGNLVGIDWGVESLATLSTGETVENLRFGAKAAAGIRKAQRKLARAKKGSRRRLKAVAHLAQQRRKVANRRKTRLHQLTAAIARRFGGIAVEDLMVRNMTASAKGTVESPGKNVRQEAGLNREILDASPGMMISMLRYKAERAGGWFAVIDARNTSQECSECGRAVLKDLSVRIHRCAHCQTEVHRDVNAARNVLKRAVAGPWSRFALQNNGLAGGRRSGNLRTKVAA
jgi:putative transposase